LDSSSVAYTEHNSQINSIVYEYGLPSHSKNGSEDKDVCDMTVEQSF